MAMKGSHLYMFAVMLHVREPQPGDVQTEGGQAAIGMGRVQARQSVHGGGGFPVRSSTRGSRCLASVVT